MCPYFFSFLILKHFGKTSANKLLVRNILDFSGLILKFKSAPYSKQLEYPAMQYSKCKVTSFQIHNFFIVIIQTHTCI